MKIVGRVFVDNGHSYYYTYFDKVGTLFMVICNSNALL